MARSLVCAGMLLVGASALTAQQSSVAVLALPGSARAAGGGDAAVFATDASSLFYDLQRLPSERSFALSAGTWIGDVQLASLAFSTPITWRAWSRPVLAVGVQSLDYGSADEYVPDPLTGGTRGTATGGRVSGNEIAASVGLLQDYGRARTGFAATYVRQTLAGLGASALVMTASQSILVGDWDLNFSVEHTGNSARNPSKRTLQAPTTTRIGVRTPALSLIGAAWSGVAEYRRATTLGTTKLAGVEGAWRTSHGWGLVLRGAALSYSDETARAKWSAGGSAERGAWSLDYAYQGYGALGAVHRMGVSWRSGGARSPSR